MVHFGEFYESLKLDRFSFIGKKLAENAKDAKYQLRHFGRFSNTVKCSSLRMSLPRWNGKKGWWCCTTNLPCIPVAIKKWTTKTPPYKFFWKNRKCPKVFNNDFKTEEGSPWIPTDTWVASRMASFSKAKEHHFLSLHTCAWGNRDTFFV